MLLVYVALRVVLAEPRTHKRVARVIVNARLNIKDWHSKKTNDKHKSMSDLF